MESGTGHGGKLTRQQEEMPGALVTGNSAPVTLRLQCLKSPSCDGKIMQGCSQKSKPHKKSTEKRMGEHRRLLRS